MRTGTRAALALLWMMLLPSVAWAADLSTGYTTDNGYDGAMFDVVAKTAIRITGFDTNLDAGTHNVAVYTKTGTLVGSQDDSTAWTLLGTVSATSTAADTPTNVPLTLNISMAPGERRAFYLASTGGGTLSNGMNYTTSSSPVGTIAAQNTDLQVEHGFGKEYPFTTTFPTDGTTGSRIWSGTVYYEPANSPPVFGALMDFTTNEDSTINLTVGVGDDSTPASSLVLSATSANTAIVANSGIVLGGTGSTRSIQITPQPDANGTARIDMVLSDGSLTTNASFQLLVDPVNDAPSFTGGADVTVAEDSGLYAQSGWATAMSAGPSNESTQGLSFEVSGNSNPGLFSVPPSVDALGRLTFVPAANASGTAQLVVRLRDTGGVARGGVDLSAPHTLHITVTPVNDPPTASDVTVTAVEDTPRSVQLQGADPENNTLTYTIVSNPQHGTLSGTGSTRTYTPDPNYAGMDSFTYRVNDGGADSAPATVSITVTPVNDSPEFVAPTPSGGATLTVMEGGTLSFIVAAQDVDGDTLTITVHGAPMGASFNPQNGAFAWSPSWTDAGTFTIRLRVTDGAATVEREVTVIVSFRDLDGDGLPDTWESQNGLDPSKVDTDGDNIADGDEVGDTANPRSSDNDGIIDALDDDSDGDGLTDAEEAGDADLATPPVDSDNDGTPDFRDTDSDNDLLLDGTDNCPTVKNASQNDLDQDMIGDACDADRDGDGVPNDVEVMWSLNPDLADTDGDNISDGDEFGPVDGPARSSDNDGTIDALDDDSDGDGLTDAQEAGDADLATPPVDTNNDGTPDFRDIDSDGDAVRDGMDNCRLVANPGQEDTDNNMIGDACDGDRDGDGVDNETDNCPDVANPGQEDTNNNMIGDACDGDMDGDGVANTADNCPHIANPGQEDLDQDMAGDACDDDIDGDSVLNELDNCPDTANTDQENLDGDMLGDACDGDLDGDSHENATDNCPEVANPSQEDMDDDRIGDACDDDIDNDGHLNDVDECPDFAAADTTNGCPTGSKGGGDREDYYQDSGVSACGCVQVAPRTPTPWPLLVISLGGLVALRRRRREAA